MISELSDKKQNVFRLWLRSTFLGWLLGIVLTIAAVIVVDSMGVPGTQFLVGAGMGAGIGFMQARAIRRLFGADGGWLWTSVLGMALPFIVYDLSRLVDIEIEFSLPICVAAGGVLVGIFQSRILKSHFDHAQWWILASGVGWVLAAGIVVLNDTILKEAIRGIAGVTGALIYLGMTFLGGLVLGALTGGVLKWMFDAQDVE